MKEELEAIEQKHKVDQQRLEKIQQVKRIGLHLQLISQDALASCMSDNTSITMLFGDLFDQLKTNYMDEVAQLGLDAMVVAVWAPIMKYKCVYWDVLADPTWGVDEIKRWRPLLRSNDDNMKKTSTGSTRRHLKQNQALVATPYETMMNTIWLSKVRSAIK
jgi:tuftelin-interacting protein 11